MSRRTKSGSIIATGRWTLHQIREGEQALRQALCCVGDRSRTRLFRMNITLCLHKACTDDEVEHLPQAWKEGLCGMAGAPVAVLWQTCADAPSCHPCADPRRDVFDPTRPDLWVPLDCGKCESCLARADIRQRYGI